METAGELTKGDRTRQRIIEKAAPIFNQHGYAGVSMQEIMEAAGLEKGGVYRHFASKEELAVASFQYALVQAIRQRTEGLERIPGAVPKLRHVIHRFVEVPSTVAGGCPLMNIAIDADDGNPMLRRLAVRTLQKWKQRIVRVLEEGMRTGEIKPQTEPRQVANLIIGTLEGSLMISRLEGSRAALRDARTSLDFLLETLLPCPNQAASGTLKAPQ